MAEHLGVESHPEVTTEDSPRSLVFAWAAVAGRTPCPALPRRLSLSSLIKLGLCENVI